MTDFLKSSSTVICEKTGEKISPKTEESKSPRSLSLTRQYATSIGQEDQTLLSNHRKGKSIKSPNDRAFHGNFIQRPAVIYEKIGQKTDESKPPRCLSLTRQYATSIGQEYNTLLSNHREEKSIKSSLNDRFFEELLSAVICEKTGKKIGQKTDESKSPRCLSLTRQYATAIG